MFLLFLYMPFLFLFSSSSFILLSLRSRTFYLFFFSCFSYLLFLHSQTHAHIPWEKNRELRERLTVREFKAWATRVKPRGRGREILQLQRPSQRKRREESWFYSFALTFKEEVVCWNFLVAERTQGMGESCCSAKKQRE